MAEKDSNIIHERRQIMIGALRYAAAGAMGIGIIGAVFKRRKLGADHVCIDRGVCTGCAVYEECRLPRALSRKQALKGLSHAG
jgi:hypothetical protein